MYEIMNVYLENGLKVILHNVPSTKTVACGVWVKQGSKYENDSTSGLSHLLEHMIVTSKNIGTDDNLIDDIVEQGIMYNATTTKEFTSYYLSGIDSNIELMISTLAKIIIDFGDFDDELLINEKMVVEREASSFYSSFKQIMERSAQSLWGNSNIGRIILGDVNNIRNATREQLINMYNKRYTPENSSLVIVGNINYTKVLEYINKYFIRWKDKKTFRIEEVINKEPGIYLNDQSGGDNSVIALCFKTPSFDSSSRNAIEILSQIMGEAGLKSRLAKEVRVKKGLAYIINTFQNFYKDRGILGITAVCSNSMVNKVAEVIVDEIKKCIENGFLEEELKGAKNKLITKRIIGLENVSDHLKFLGKASCYNEGFSLERELRNIRNVELEDINNVAKKIFIEDNMGLAVIGDSDIDELLEILKFD